MEERKVKITIDNGDDCYREITGRAVIGFTFDTGQTADGKTDAAFFVGRGYHGHEAARSCGRQERRIRNRLNIF